jgi:hypothetical protein
MRSWYCNEVSEHSIRHFIYKYLFVDLSAGLLTFTLSVSSSKLLWEFCQTVCNIKTTRRWIVKNTVHRIQDQVIGYLWKSKSWESDKIWPHGWPPKVAYPRAMKLSQLWLPVSPATAVRRDQARASFTCLDEFYQIPKYRIPKASIRVFLTEVKWAWTPKFRWGLRVKIPISGSEFVLLHPILRACLSELLETNFVSPSYIDLGIPPSEFSCNLSVQLL